VIRDESGRAVALTKALSEDVSGLPTEVCAGLYVYSSGIWQDERMMSRPPDLGGEWNVDALNSSMLSSGGALVVQHAGEWLHVNSAQDLARADRALRNSPSTALE
jgi:NDP-sugar pyrophosphorylase family protein